MRLRELVLGRGERGQLPEHVREELEAIDAALAGERVPDSLAGLAELTRDLRAERPEPDAQFAARLDRWAESGFEAWLDPRRSRENAEREAMGPGGVDGAAPARARAGGRSDGRRRPSFWLRLREPWVPALAVALLALVVVASTVVIRQGGDVPGSGGAGVSQSGTQGEAADGVESSRTSGGEGAPGERGVLDALEPQAGSADGASRAFRGRIVDEALVDPARPYTPDSAPDSRPGNAAGADVRRVERDAQLELAAPADEVQGVADEAIAVVDRHDGLVLSSRVSGGAGKAKAVLELQIPSRNLDPALAELKDLADVRSFSEGSTDITAPFLDARKRLAERRAERRSLLRQIEAATTTEQLDELRRRLRALDARLERAKLRFDRMQHRARQARVSLVVSSEGAREDEWSLGEALDDAGRVLTVAASVTLVAGAVLLPLALFAALALLLIRAWRGRARERALDESG
jgi:hypothetical protein